MHADIAFATSGLAFLAGFQGNIQIGFLALNLMLNRNNCRFCHIRVGKRSGFNLFGPQSMTGNIDDIIDSAEGCGRTRQLAITAASPVRYGQSCHLLLFGSLQYLSK